MPSLPADQTLKAFANRLANLSGQNKTLLLPRLSAGQELDVASLAFAQGRPAFWIVEQFMAGARRVALTSLGQEGGQDAELARRLKNIARKEAQLTEETGAADLCLAWPFVQGRWATGQLVRAPLILWPCTLRLEGNKWYLVRREDEPAGLNQALLLAYAHYQRAALPDVLLEEDLEDAPTDPLAFRTWLYELLKGAEMGWHFNQELFREPLRPFAAYTRAELEAATADGLIKLQPEAVIGLFPQADPYLAQDYDLLLDQGLTVADIFSGTSKPAELLPDEEHELHPGDEVELAVDATTLPPTAALAPETEALLAGLGGLSLWPLETDASQESILSRLHQGESLCVQGPPGTGKSQLIANAVADGLARGRRVLVVCQKRAALEVVASRLSEVGLADHYALLQDIHLERRSLYDQLSTRLEGVSLGAAPIISPQLPAALTAYQALGAHIGYGRSRAEELRKALYNPAPAGRPIHSLYLEAAPGQPTVGLEGLEEHFPYPSADIFTRTLQRLQRLREALAGTPRFWLERRSLAGAGQSELTALREIVLQWDGRQTQLSRLSCKKKAGPKQWASWQKRNLSSPFLKGLDRARLLLARPEIAVLARELCQPRHQKLVRRLSQQAALFRKQDLSAKALPAIRVEAARIALVRPEEKGLLVGLRGAIQARQGGWLAWVAFSLLRTPARPALSLAEGTDLPALEAAMHGLKAYLRVRAFGKRLAHRLPQRTWPQDPADKKAWTKALAELEDALWLARYYHRYKLGKAVARRWFSGTETKRQAWFDTARHELAGLADYYAKAHRHLSGSQLKALIEATSPAAPLAGVLDVRFEALAETDTLAQAMPPHERQALARLLAYKTKPGSTIPPLHILFEASLRLAWIAKIEAEAPILRQAGQATYADELDELAQATVERQAQARRLAPALARAWQQERLAQVSRPLKELAHQLAKKRRVWPVRKLMAAYSGQLLTLAPCWLLSPETASAVLPMVRAMFDLVIFDEASQCFAERGLPAAYRGAHLLITGDTRQLRPSDLYRVRFTTDEEPTEAEQEAASLLELAALHLPQARLQGHYRSRRPELIAFSDRHFYQGSLQMLPSAEAMQDPTPALRYHPTPGNWVDNQNVEEARAVRDFVLEHLATNPSLSLGVVTFNQPQQSLLLDMLEEAFAANHQPWPQGPGSLFVKNIENVQGDERDVIVFSIAYAPVEGRLAMNFGSLSMPGGENRLNVAVTRARVAMHVFSGITGADFRLTEASPPGVRLLADFLDYARMVGQAAEGDTVTQALPLAAPPAGLSALLTARDPSLAPGLPLADLISRGAIPWGLTFTDEAPLAQAEAAWAYLSARPARARRLGWAIERYWARQVMRGQL